MLDPIRRTAAEKSTSRHRMAQSSPRRAPVVIASQTSMPQSGPAHAVVAIAAVWADVGGWGSAFGSAGGSAWRTGLLPTQRHRTARVKAPLSRLWVWRTDEVLSGLQACGRGSPARYPDG